MGARQQVRGEGSFQSGEQRRRQQVANWHERERASGHFSLGNGRGARTKRVARLRRQMMLELGPGVVFHTGRGEGGWVQTGMSVQRESASPRLLQAANNPSLVAGSCLTQLLSSRCWRLRRAESVHVVNHK